MSTSRTREKADKLTYTQAEVTAGDTAARAGRKNLIINGAMQVAQRGTSSTGNGYVSLDRWYSNQSGASTTFSQETNTNPSETGGIKSYARLNVSSSSDYTGISQKIEDVTSVPSGTVTLSFWAKGTAPVGGLYVNSAQDFGTGGSGDVDIAGILITSSLTSSWVKYSTQITIPSVDGKTIGAGSFFNLAINQGTNSSSTAYDLNITGVQLETGSVATDFEHRSYGEELSLCQRYYQVYGGTAYATIASGFQPNSTNAKFHLSYMQEMRAVPSIGTANSAELIVTDRTGFDQPLAGFGGHVAGKTSAYISVTMSAVGAQDAGLLLAVKNGTTATVNLNAEL